MKIDIKKLSIGLHELKFEESTDEINLKDIEMFPNPIVSKVSIDKAETHLYVKANVGSKAHFSCDRCLQEFDRQVEENFRLYFEVVSLGSQGHLVDDDDESQDDNVRIIRPNQKEIDLTPDIRDTILLSIPMKVVCSESCKGICPKCKKDLNVEICICSENEIDPRWEGLQKLLEKEQEK